MAALFNFNKNCYYVLLVVLLLLVSACKPKNTQRATTIAPIEKNITNNPFYKEILAHQLAFSTLHSKLNVNYNDGLVDQDFTAVVRIKKDSVIWLSLQGPFGIEGARILVTNDSFFLQNKLNNQLIKDKVNAIEKYIGVPVSFHELQALLVGEMLPEFTVMNDTLFNDSTQLVYTQNKASDTYTYINLKNYTPSEILWKDLLNPIQMKINFEDYKAVGNAHFSYDRKYAITQGSKQKKVAMQVQKVRINEELSFPF